MAAPKTPHFYPIGRAGQSWDESERAAWLQRASVVQRSYQAEVLSKLEGLRTQGYDVQQYGALSQNPARYPLYVVKTKKWTREKPSLFITGGTHGYEVSF